MAKAAENKELVQVDTGSVPAFMQERINEVAGLGNSTDAQDNTMPFLAILHSSSPQVEENKPEYIEGAKKGMLFNTATKELFDGKEGLWVIPFAFQKALVEWTPRSSGGGYQNSYDWDDPIRKTAKPKLDEKTGKPRGLVLPNGNDLIETTYTLALVPGQSMPIVIGATSTRLKPMRDWMTLRNNINIGGKIAPAFAKKYLVQTVYQENESGSWYNYKITAGDWVDQGDFDRALEFAEMAAKGNMSVGRPADAMNEGGGDHPVDDGIPV